jgi:hypothetical protein
MIAGLAAQAAGREESPDTESAQAEWATRLVTPGGWPRRFRRKAKFHASACGAGFHPVQVRLSYGQCHREYTAGNVQPGDSPKENLRDIFAWCACRQG